MLDPNKIFVKWEVVPPPQFVKDTFKETLHVQGEAPNTPVNSPNTHLPGLIGSVMFGYSTKNIEINMRYFSIYKGTEILFNFYSFPKTIFRDIILSGILHNVLKSV